MDIAQRVRELIHDGTLGVGDAVPSTRALAADWGVARGTVTAAYEQLDGEGYVRTRQGAPTLVVADVRIDRVPSVSRPPSPAPDPNVIDAPPGSPSPAAISSADRGAAWRVALGTPAQSATTPAAGATPLREQIAARLALSRGFAPTVERIVVSAGTSEALSLLVEAMRRLHSRAPRIAIEDPGYIGGRTALASAGAELVPIPVTDEGMDLALLRSMPRPDAVMVTPTHQYPLGSVMPVTRRRELLEWAAREGVTVIEDDYDSEFRHGGSPVPALAALDVEGVVVHVGGFSKTLDPRLRCAYAVVPSGAFGDALRSARSARGPVVAEPVQLALAHLMRTGALRRHLGRARRDYAHKRDRIAARTEAVAGVRASALQGGLHVVLTWPRERAAAGEVVARLEHRGIRVADLSRYAASPQTAAALNGIVVGYGNITLTQVDAVLDAVFALSA